MKFFLFLHDFAKLDEHYKPYFFLSFPKPFSSSFSSIAIIVKSSVENSILTFHSHIASFLEHISGSFIPNMYT